MRVKKANAFILWLGVYIMLRLVAPHISIGPPVVGTIIAAVAFIVVSLSLIVAAARMQMANRTRILFAIAPLAVWIGAIYLRLDRVAAISIIADAALMSCAANFGVLVSYAIREPKLLLPVAVCAGLVDIWGVNVGGPVKKIAEKAPTVIPKASAKVPAFGSAKSRKMQRETPTIGFGDFFFLGLFFACIVRFGLNLWPTFWLVVPLTIIALLAVPSTRALILPGLPFIAVGVILPNVQHFHFTREEKFALLYAGLLLGAVFIVSRRMFR